MAIASRIMCYNALIYGVASWQQSIDEWIIADERRYFSPQQVIDIELSNRRILTKECRI